MAACKGCNNRLGLPVGTSGHCNPCYLATRIERVGLTRYPPAKAEELTHFLAKVLNTLEADSEAFEADKTAGCGRSTGVFARGEEGREGQVASQQLAAGVHPGEQHPQAASARVKKEKQEESEAGTPGSSSSTQETKTGGQGEVEEQEPQGGTAARPRKNLRLSRSRRWLQSPRKSKRRPRSKQRLSRRRTRR